MISLTSWQRHCDLFTQHVCYHIASSVNSQTMVRTNGLILSSLICIGSAFRLIQIGQFYKVHMIEKCGHRHLICLIPYENSCEGSFEKIIPQLNLAKLKNVKLF